MFTIYATEELQVFSFQLTLIPPNMPLPLYWAYILTHGTPLISIPFHLHQILPVSHTHVRLCSVTRNLKLAAKPFRHIHEGSNNLIVCLLRGTSLSFIMGMVDILAACIVR